MFVAGLNFKVTFTLHCWNHWAFVGQEIVLGHSHKILHFVGPNNSFHQDSVAAAVDFAMHWQWDNLQQSNE